MNLHANRQRLTGILAAIALGATVIAQAGEPAPADSAAYPEPLRSRSTWETVAAAPGAIAYAPVRLTTLGLGYAGVQLVESGIIEKLMKLLRGTGVAPVYAPRTGGGIRYVSTNTSVPRSYLLLTATTWLDFRQLYGIQWQNVSLFRGAIRSDYALRYRSMTNEAFFGLGPHSREDDLTVFAQEDVLFEITLHRRLSSCFLAKLDVGISNTSIFESRNDDEPSITSVYSDSTVPGITESIRLQGTEFALKYDDTNHPAHPTAGRLSELGAALFLDVEDDRFSFWKLSADLTQHVHLIYDRTLVLRVAAEMTEGANNTEIPFYHLAELGSAETIRGFARGRFRACDYVLGSAEYRYPIWIPWAKVVDATLFVDAGQVADDVLQDATIPDLAVGYGGGFRFYSGNHLITKTEIAFSKDGYRFYLTLNP